MREDPLDPSLLSGNRIKQSYPTYHHASPLLEPRSLVIADNIQHKDRFHRHTEPLPLSISHVVDLSLSLSFYIMSHRNETSFSGAEVHVGSPPRDFPERTTVYYHDFKGLRWKRNGVIRSPKFSCLGRQWRLAMKIEERDRSAGVEISASLHHAAGDPISVGWSVSVRSSHLPEPSIGENEGTFHPREGSIFYTLPLKQHYSRYLEKGTLVFDVLMNSHEHEPPLPFIPKNPMACNFVQRLFNDENSADIVFTVAHRDPSNNDLIGPLTTTKFYAHSLILKSAAPLLAELCK